VDEKATNTADAVARDPAARRTEPINAIPEIPSSTVRETPRRVVTPARLFNTADETANPPRKKRRPSNRRSLMVARGAMTTQDSPHGSTTTKRKFEFCFFTTR
jgi:hypothetical protein